MSDSIDVHCEKLIEWLETRNKLSKGEWIKDLNALQIKKANAIALLPTEMQSLVQGVSVDYFSCLKIIRLLEKANTDAGKSGKNIFGTYTDLTLKVWDELVKTYLKNNVYLAECARILVQSVSYEIPALKKTTEAGKKQLQELTKQVEESNKKATEARSKFQTSLTQLGINGEACENEQQLRDNLLSTTKDLKTFLNDVVQKSQTKGVNDATTFYQQFHDFTLAQANLPTISSPLLPTLRKINEVKVDEAVTMLEQDSLRQEFVTDLSELLAFLTSRLNEFQQGFRQSDSVADSVLAQAPALVQSHQSSAVEAYVSAVNAVLETVKVPRFQQLLMISKSKRYVDRLVNTTIQHLQTAARFSETATSSEQRIAELKDTVAEGRKNLEAYVRVTKELKAQLEAAISKEFGRTVHLFGDIPQN